MKLSKHFTSLSKFAAFALLCLFFGADTLSANGGMTSGGDGDNFSLTKRTFKTAWFLGDRPVTYCLRTSENFSLPLDAPAEKESIRSVLRESLADWLSTVKAFNKLALTESSYQLATNFNEVECGSGEDLVFYFGVVEKDVKTLLDASKISPAAYSFVRSHDRLEGRTMGYVWLSPDKGDYRYHPNGGNDGSDPDDGFWSLKNRMRTVLLHELGHVFGVPHTAGTFMSGLSTQLLGLIPALKVRKMETSELLTMNWFEAQSRFCATFESRLDDEVNYQHLFGESLNIGDLAARFCLERAAGGQGYDFKVQMFKGSPARFTPYLDTSFREPGVPGTIAPPTVSSTNEDPLIIYANSNVRFLTLARTVQFTSRASWKATDGKQHDCTVKFNLFAQAHLSLIFICPGEAPIEFGGRDRFPLE